MAVQMGASLAIFIKTIVHKIKQRKKNAMLNIVVSPKDSAKNRINPSFRSVDDNNYDEVYRMAPKQEEYLKKKMFEDSSILSQRVIY